MHFSLQDSHVSLGAEVGYMVEIEYIPHRAMCGSLVPRLAVLF